MSNNKSVKLLVENWRIFLEEKELTKGKAEAEQALKSITDIFTNAVKQEAPSIEKEIQAKITKKSQEAKARGESVEESAVLGALGATLAIPRIIKLISKIVKNLGKAMGAKMKDENFLDHLAHDIHHQYQAAIKLALKLIPSIRKQSEERQDKIAEYVLNAIIAGLMLSSSFGATAALQHGDLVHGGIEAALAAIKKGELENYIEKAFTS